MSHACRTSGQTVSQHGQLAVGRHGGCSHAGRPPLSSARTRGTTAPGCSAWPALGTWGQTCRSGPLHVAARVRRVPTAGILVSLGCGGEVVASAPRTGLHSPCRRSALRDGCTFVLFLPRRTGHPFLAPQSSDPPPRRGGSCVSPWL